MDGLIQQLEDALEQVKARHKAAKDAHERKYLYAAKLDIKKAIFELKEAKQMEGVIRNERKSNI